MMARDEAANKLKVYGRQENLRTSGDVKCHLVERLRACEQFSFQLDESAEVANAAQLLVYVNCR